MLSEDETKLLVGSLQNKLYLYETNSIEIRPPRVYEGIKGNYFVKAQFSPDNQFLVGGSADSKIHIWDIE